MLRMTSGGMEMADVPPARLAEIVPARWDETRRRIVAVRRLLEEDDQSGRTIMRYADELGVSRQMIYKLIGIVRNWDAAGDAPPAPTRWSAHDPIADALIRQAVSDVGTGAIASRVFERTVQLAAARGVPPPSIHSVYTAMGKRPAGTALALRLSLAGGVILDASRLAVRIRSDQGPPRDAHLVTAFDLNGGDLVAWALGEDEVGAREIGRILTALDAVDGIFATSAIPIAEHATISRAPARVKPGSAMRAALGASIGRMRLLSATTGPSDLPVVSREDLLQVLRSVLTMQEAGAAT